VFGFNTSRYLSRLSYFILNAFTAKPTPHTTLRQHLATVA